MKKITNNTSIVVNVKENTYVTFCSAARLCLKKMEKLQIIHSI